MLKWNINMKLISSNFWVEPWYKIMFPLAIFSVILDIFCRLNCLEVLLSVSYCRIWRGLWLLKVAFQLEPNEQELPVAGSVGWLHKGPCGPGEELKYFSITTRSPGKFQQGVDMIGCTSFKKRLQLLSGEWITGVMMKEKVKKDNSFGVSLVQRTNRRYSKIVPLFSKHCILTSTKFLNLHVTSDR